MVRLAEGKPPAARKATIQRRCSPRVQNELDLLDERAIPATHFNNTLSEFQFKNVLPATMPPTPERQASFCHSFNGIYPGARSHHYGRNGAKSLAALSQVIELLSVVQRPSQIGPPIFLALSLHCMLVGFDVQLEVVYPQLIDVYSMTATEAPNIVLRLTKGKLRTTSKGAIERRPASSVQNELELLDVPQALLSTNLHNPLVWPKFEGVLPAPLSSALKRLSTGVYGLYGVYPGACSHHYGFNVTKGLAALDPVIEDLHRISSSH